MTPYYAKHRERLREQARLYAQRRRRMRGVACKRDEMEERERKAIEAFPLFLTLLLVKAHEAREARMEQWRQNARNYRRFYPDKKREQDRAYREANREKVRAQTKARKDKALALGYRWKPSAESIARQKEYARRHNLLVTAAHRYLVSIGVAEWWGPGETSQARRMAAYVYAREQGLLPSSE